MKTWTLSEAKNKLSEVVERALREGPQEVSVATKEPVVIISRKELDRMVPGGVKRFFETAPDLDELADMVAQLRKQGDTSLMPMYSLRRRVAVAIPRSRLGSRH